MVDIHHHLLHGLDDGPGSFEVSLAMARMAARDGITHLAATPHSNHRFELQPEQNESRLAALRDALAKDGVSLELGVGCDFHLSYDNIRSALEQPQRFTLNHHGYLLVELPDHLLPPGLEESFYQLRLAGLVLILTHPERNPALQRDNRRLKQWLRDGMLVQVTANSVTGAMGRAAQRMAHRLLADRWVHFIASDAHNETSRPPLLSPAYALVAQRYGDEYACRLFTQNPLAAFEGRPLPPQEEPIALYDNDANPGWWQRLLGRHAP